MQKQSIPIIKHCVYRAKIKPFANTDDFVLGLANNIVNSLDLHVVNKVEHRFSPQGITIVWVLAESHLAIHTWPELGYLHVDLVTCSNKDSNEIEKVLSHILDGNLIESSKIQSIY